MCEKKLHQPPLNISGQIENLKGLGLRIDDEVEAAQFLHDVSYFRLIKAFGLGLKEKNSSFQPGTTFSQIKDLYLFNCNFRQNLFPVIEHIEINLRCRIANYFSSKYGPLGYEDPNNFQNAYHHETIISEIHSEIRRNSRSPFVKNFTEHYVDGKLPFYAVIELFSFGTLSKFFKNMNNNDKSAVAKTFGVPYTYLESWIENIAFVRNICAHYGRLYNFKLVKTPILYKEYTNKGVKNNRIFASLLCMKHLLRDDTAEWKNFLAALDEMLEKYIPVDIALMGFPENWKLLLAPQ